MTARPRVFLAGAVFAVLLAGYALWPSRPSDQQATALVRSYLGTRPEERSAALEHRVMQLRGQAAVGAVACLSEPRLRDAAQGFLRMCARSAGLPVPVSVTQIEAKAKSENRPSRISSADSMATAFREEEWTVIAKSWESWARDNEKPLRDMQGACDSRYEL
jgi:hypothetical protein